MQVTVGEDGIEKEFESKLRGVRGLRITERDGHEREMVSLRAEDVPAKDGLNVVLTVDSVLQQMMETELAQGQHDFSAVNICGLAIRPRTGEILAMASLPNFDPNHPGGPGVVPEMLRNRVIKDAPEPGSTFKIVVISGALNDHLVKLTDRFDCEHGEFKYAGVMLHDHNGGSGILEVKDIIAKSSNIGAAKIGIMMKEQRLNDYVHAFGFGATTGVALPYEFKGIVNDRTNWSKISITRIPMGQEIGVTPLQMAMAMCAIANKGILMQPMLVDRLTAPDGTIAVKYNPQPMRRVIGEEADHDIIEALKTVVLTGGTAVGAAMTNYTVAGKTGTAQEAGPHGYSDRNYYASFIGFFPADNPEICIYVGMELDDPKGAHEGGRTSALVFKKIATQAATYLNIRPDRGSATGVPEPEPAPTTAPEQPLRTFAAHM
jgi:cell division protein FtsI/penicillin-binding protein 2